MAWLNRGTCNVETYPMTDMDSGSLPCGNLPKHLVRAGEHEARSDDDPNPSDHRGFIEPWLSALFQVDHLNLLVGSGFTNAIANTIPVPLVDLSAVSFQSIYGADAVSAAAASGATRVGRKKPNFEDQARAVLDLIGGFRVLAEGKVTDESAEQQRHSANTLATRWTAELDRLLSTMLKNILATERAVHAALTNGAEEPNHLRRLLGGFILPFASRVPNWDRAHIFTTNYDRLLEYSSDLLGLRIIDRFIGALAPVFHSSRLGVDLHYNPPGIRGEPRYLEGVVRLTKLHGSVDWRSHMGPSARHEVQRVPLPFGANDDHPGLPANPADQLLIYPNASKDVETLAYPYAELFRDFSAAACRPNAVVVTYGFGFGDDHVNRILRDMLNIPSTHIVIISYDDAAGRIQAFLESAGHEEQITLLLGPHFGNLGSLVDYYLPKPAIDRTTWKMVEMLNRRTPPAKPEAQESGTATSDGDAD